MRLIIELKPESEQNLLSVDIQFLIPKLIKFVFSKANQDEFAKFQTKPLSDYLNFNLKISPKPRVYNDTLIVGGNYKLFITVSSYSKEIIDLLNQGLLKMKHLLIQNHKFSIQNLEIVESQISTDTIKVIPMAPVLSGKTAEEQKFPFYFKWNSPEFMTTIEENIKSEYNTVFNTIPEEGIKVKYDDNYLKFHQNISQIVVVGKRKQKAVWAPLYLSGSKELIQFALDMGIGLNRDQGYGMLDVYTPKPKSEESFKKPKRVNVDDLPDNFGNTLEYNKKDVVDEEPLDDNEI